MSPSQFSPLSDKNSKNGAKVNPLFLTVPAFSSPLTFPDPGLDSRPL
ncbi:hypothetical protein MVUOKPPV_CDS0307 [Klebsiella phage phi1_175008]|uniref:Uncharacterized protein n=1 Tax=Klebsiella phage phi1_175008 TaxID=3127744 RepID=A0ACD5FRH8_9CAUD